MTLTREIMEICTTKGIRIRQTTADMVVLDNVPLDPQALSKPATNLCVIRDPQSQRFLAWVDADLAAKEAGQRYARLFTGQTRDKWQLVTPREGFASAERALTETLRRLSGAPARRTLRERAKAGREEPLRGSLLPLVARRVRADEPRLPLRHRDQTLELATSLVQSGPAFVVLAGPSGSGLTACALEVLLQQAARETASHPTQIDCALVATEMLYPASSDERFRQMLAECAQEPDTLYLLDNVNWVLRVGGLAQAALATAIQRGLRGLATFQCEGDFPELLPSLARRLHVLTLPPFDTIDLLDVLSRHAELLKAQHGLSVAREALSACVQLAVNGVGADPGRVLGLLDAAAALALSNETETIGPDEIAAARSTLCTQP
jgi:hypothetical protein